jgi:hypothetical protein
MMPMNDPALNLSSEEEQKVMQENVGKPWAFVFYHTAMHGMDPMYMVRGFLHAFVAALMVSLVLMNGNWNGFNARFLVSMAFAVFVIVLAPLNNMNWWDMPWSFVRPQVLDMVFGWGLASLWLARYVKK